MRVTIITGASSGIGKSLSYQFAKRGHNLLLIARSEEKLRTISEELNVKYAVNTMIFPVDLLQEDAPQKIFDYVQEKSLCVECLINNAGIGDAGVFSESKWEKQENIVRLNILALTHMTHLFLQLMKTQTEGTIINIASALAFAPTAGQSVYAASKAFVLSFGQALYEELKGTPISVLTICPGVTRTEFFHNAGFELNQFNAASPDDFAEFAYSVYREKKALSIHRFSNRITALFCRLGSRKLVRKVFASVCKNNE